jgi:hypothetical protein
MHKRCSSTRERAHLGMHITHIMAACSHTCSPCIPVFFGVDTGNQDITSAPRICLGQRFPLWGESLAVLAPSCAKTRSAVSLFGGKRMSRHGLYASMKRSFCTQWIDGRHDTLHSSMLISCPVLFEGQRQDDGPICRGSAFLEGPQAKLGLERPPA